MNGESLIKLWQQLDSEASNWRTLWQECADWCLPQKDNINKINLSTLSGEEKPPQRMIDTCIEANFNFASGMYSYMFPSGTIWAKFKHPDPQLMGEKSVADYFERVSRTIHEMLVSSNFAQEIQESILDMGAFGTNCVYVEKDDSGLNFRSFTVAEVRISLNSKGRVDTVGRKIHLTGRQMMQEFGEKALIKGDLKHVVDEVKSGTARETKFEVIHLIRPNEDWNPEKLVAENKRYESVYICEKTKKILKKSGYDEMPYFVGRFTVGNNETYGRSPMSMKLATARRTNSIYRSMLISSENHANPQWLLPDDDSVSFKGHPNRSGTMVYWNASNPNGKPEPLKPNGNPGIALEMFQFHESEIKRGFFNHLFRPLDDYRNMTAYEANQRMTTDLMALAPFISRYQDEVVSKMLSYVYYLLQKDGLLPEVPMALAESPNFEIEYVGKLSLATKNFEVAGAFQTLQMFAELAQGTPSAQEGIMNVDMDALFRQAWYSASASMNALKDPEDVDAERAAIAEQQQQQMMMNAAPGLADAYGKGGKAAEPGSLSATMMGGE
jgi:hypothetical protein